MARLTSVDPRVMDRALREAGLRPRAPEKQSRPVRHPDGRTTTVPHHKGRDLAVPLVRTILADVRMSVDDFMRLLQS